MGLATANKGSATPLPELSFCAKDPQVFTTAMAATLNSLREALKAVATEDLQPGAETLADCGGR